MTAPCSSSLTPRPLRKTATCRTLVDSRRSRAGAERARGGPAQGGWGGGRDREGGDPPGVEGFAAAREEGQECDPGRAPGRREPPRFRVAQAPPQAGHPHRGEQDPGVEDLRG